MIFRRKEFKTIAVLNQIHEELAAIAAEYDTLPTAPLLSDGNDDTGYTNDAPQITGIVEGGNFSGARRITSAAVSILMYDAGKPRILSDFSATTDFYGSFKTSLTSDFSILLFGAYHDIRFFTSVNGVSWGEAHGIRDNSVGFPGAAYSTSAPDQKRFSATAPVYALNYPIRYFAVVNRIVREAQFYPSSPGERSVSARLISQSVNLSFLPDPDPDPDPCPKLPAPTRILADADNVTRLTLVSWDAVPGADGYVVRRDGVVVQQTKLLQWQDRFDSAAGVGAALLRSPGHVYSVCAVNSCGDGVEAAAAGMEAVKTEFSPAV